MLCYYCVKFIIMETIFLKVVKCKLLVTSFVARSNVRIVALVSRYVSYRGKIYRCSLQLLYTLGAPSPCRSVAVVLFFHPHAVFK